LPDNLRRRLLLRCRLRRLLTRRAPPLGPISPRDCHRRTVAQPPPRSPRPHRPPRSSFAPRPRAASLRPRSPMAPVRPTRSRGQPHPRRHTRYRRRACGSTDHDRPVDRLGRRPRCRRRRPRGHPPRGHRRRPHRRRPRRHRRRRPHRRRPRRHRRRRGHSRRSHGHRCPRRPRRPTRRAPSGEPGPEPGQRCTNASCMADAVVREPLMASPQQPRRGLSIRLLDPTG
ncbi:MAG: hypothetical protein QOI36_3549, partial [Pseudonocardiales bacterium]|nr:hypothetical protein [Pseudonocardiales bacterium]